MSLYKYTRPANARFLAPCTLRFSPASEFNDPFDGLPDTAALTTMPEYQRIKNEWEGLAMHDPSDLELARGAAMAGELIEQKAKTGMIKRLLADLNQNFRILCLSHASPESMGAALMFGHYADNHKGFAYEFDEHHPWFAEHEARRNPSREIGPVVYRQHRATVVGDGRQGLFVKSSLWWYEEEFRLVRYIGAGANGLSGADHSIARFPPDMLTAILVGCMAEVATVDELKKQLASRPELAHVRLERMIPHPDAFLFTREGI
ncbi:MAG: DUF2971 domain-containing protein [Opitutae bacterium]|nr:DUF2971 domain-containing protein [Opitutae bacterium]